MPKSWQWPQNSCKIESSDRRQTQIRRSLSSVQAVVCVLSQCIEDSTIISYLYELAQEGRRVYLLIGKYSPKLDKLRGYCLIRVLPMSILPHGSLILADPGSCSAKCLLLSSNSLGEHNQVELLCTTNKYETIEELFSYFCYLFWERADTEYLCDSDTAGRAIVDKGVDVYFDVEQLQAYYLYDQILTNTDGLSRSTLLGEYISLAPEMQHLRIEASGERNLNDITFLHLPTKEDFTQVYPDNFPDELGCLETSYRWRVLPYYLPKGAELSSFYKDWDKYSKATLEDLDGLFCEINRKRSSAQPNRGTDYARLRLDFTGSLDDIQKRLEAFKSVRWGYDPATYSKAKELKSLKFAYQAICKKFDNEVKCLELEQELRQNKEERGNLKRSIEMLSESKKLNEHSQRGQRDTEAEERQIKEKIKHLDYETSRIQHEIERIKASTDKPEDESSLELLYNKEQNGGRRELQTDDPSVTPPILPSVGCLFQVKQKLYLAIDDWDEYDRGLSEATRIGAELCANSNEHK